MSDIQKCVLDTAKKLNILDDFSETIVRETISWSPIILKGIIIAVAFYYIAALVAKAFTALVERSHLANHKGIIFGISTIRSIISVTGILIMVNSWGIDTSALLAGLGITGFALGLALKDIIASAIGGILITLDNPFDIGDYIEVMGVEGEVTDIGIRYISIIDKSKIHMIPNVKLVSEIVTVCRHKKTAQKG